MLCQRLAFSAIAFGPAARSRDFASKDLHSFSAGGSWTFIVARTKALAAYPPPRFAIPPPHSRQRRSTGTQSFRLDAFKRSGDPEPPSKSLPSHSAGCTTQATETFPPPPVTPSWKDAGSKPAQTKFWRFAASRARDDEVLARSSAGDGVLVYPKLDELWNPELARARSVAVVLCFRGHR